RLRRASMRDGVQPGLRRHSSCECVPLRILSSQGAVRCLGSLRARLSLLLYRTTRTCRLIDPHDRRTAYLPQGTCRRCGPSFQSAASALASRQEPLALILWKIVIAALRLTE